MKKKLLPLAMAAATGRHSLQPQSLYLNNDGFGEVIFYPRQTELNEIKVRIVEAMNSSEVLDLNLYLSPQEHWKAVRNK